MKNFLGLTLLLLLSVTKVSAQTSNINQLAEQVEEKHIWMTGYMVKNYFTVNADKGMWDALLGAAEFPYGHIAFNNMAQALVDYADAAEITSLNKKCGFTVQTDVVKSMMPTCKEQMDGLKGKLSFTLNAQGVSFNKISYKMMLGYMSSVREFFYERAANVKNGWRTKNGQLNIVINVSDKNKVMGVSWSTDKNTVTISGPATTELAGWDAVIINGLTKGGK